MLRGKRGKAAVPREQRVTARPITISIARITAIAKAIAVGRYSVRVFMTAIANSVASSVAEAIEIVMIATTKKATTTARIPPQKPTQTPLSLLISYPR